MRKRFEGKNPAIAVGSATAKLPGSNFYTENTAATFAVKHFSGEVEYPIRDLVEDNGEVISGDLMNLINSSRSEFVSRLFGQEALQTVTHPLERSTVMQASVSSRPMRAPSIMSRTGRSRRRLHSRQTSRSQGVGSDEEEGGAIRPGGPAAGGRSDSKLGGEQGASGQFLAALDNVTQSFTEPGTNCYFVFCLKPNDRRIANQFDSKCVRAQGQTFGIAEISQRLRAADFSIFLPFGEFLGLLDAETVLVGSDREKVEAIVEDRSWPTNEALVGSTGVFLSERVCMDLALRGDMGSQSGRYASEHGETPGLPGDGPFAASKERLLRSATNTPLGFGPGDRKTGYFGGPGDVSDVRSEAGVSAIGAGDMFRNLDTRAQMAERGNEKELVEVEEFKDSASRKRWLFLVHSLTFLVPDFAVRLVGRMPRKDVRIAWREKLAINLLIWFVCLVAAFLMVGFPKVVCPTQHVYSAAELSSNNGKSGMPAYAAIRGQVFDIGEFASRHYPTYLPTKDVTQYGGLDITSLFPVQVSALCRGVDPSKGIDPAVLLDYKSTNTSGSAAVISSQDINAQYHDFRYFTNDSRPDWFAEQMIMLKANYKVGNIGYTADYVAKLASKQNSVAILHSHVYDMSEYVSGGRHQKNPVGQAKPDDPNAINFLDDMVVDLFTQRAGTDVSALWESLRLTPTQKKDMKLCLDNLFYVGDVDTRNSARCLLAEYMILAISALLQVLRRPPVRHQECSRAAGQIPHVPDPGVHRGRGLAAASDRLGRAHAVRRQA